MTLVEEHFWDFSQFGYGVYGSLTYNDYLYLYAQAPSGGIALAKVPTDSVEDKSTYQYYNNNAWSTEMPANVNATSAYLTHPGAGGQGTYFYSGYFSCFVWMGQPSESIAPDLWVSISPAPEGPWIEPYFLHAFPDGTGTFGGYSLQAHPDLVQDPKSNVMYITYTKVDKDYATPLYQLDFD
jgi:hypothetical protein